MSSDGNNNATPAPRKRRWLWPLLIVSLALNLLFVGFVAGRVWTYDGRAAQPHRIVAGAIEELRRDLPASKDQLARELLASHRERVRALQGEFRQARRAARAAVLAEPYDEAKLAAALARMREIRTGQHKSMHSMVMELLKDLTLEERKILLRHIRAGFRRGHGRWGRGRGGPREGPPGPGQ